MGCCTSAAHDQIHQPLSQLKPPPPPKQKNPKPQYMENPPTNNDQQSQQIEKQQNETHTQIQEQVEIKSESNQLQIQQEQHLQEEEDKLTTEFPIKHELNPFQKLKQLGLKKQKQKIQREQKLAPLMEDLVNRLYEKSLNYEEIKKFCEDKEVSFTDVLLYTDNMDNSLIQIMANLDDYELFLQCFEQIQFQDGDLIYSIQKKIFQKLEKHQKGSPEQIHYIIHTLKQLEKLIENKELLNYVQITNKIDTKSQIEYDEIQYVYSKFNQEKQIQSRYYGNYLNLFNSLKVNLQLQKECILFDFGSYINEFMILMQRASLSAINQFLEDYQLPDQICHKSTNQRLNIIHCLCQNKYVNSSDYQLQKLLNSLNQCHKIDELLVQPYHDQVPLVYYLDNQKEINQIMIEFLQKPFLNYTFNIRKINFQSQLLAQLFKVAQIKPFDQIEGWGPKLAITKPPIIQKNKKCHKTNKNQHNQLNKDLQNYIEQLTDQFNQIYLYNVQVAKQLIKHKFQNLNFSWIKWNCSSSKLPTDIGGQQTGLISLLIRNGFSDQAYQEIQNIEEVEQDYEFLDLVNNQLKELGILEIIEYCQHTQFASKLLVYFKELKQYPCEKIIIYIISKISEIIQQQPQILCNQIIGNSIFYNNQYETIYTSLYLIQDQNLLGTCLSVKPIISQDKRIIHLLLINMMELKIIDKINDPFEKALFNRIDLVGRLYLSQYAFCFNFHQISEENQIQDDESHNVINIRTIFKINTKLVNNYILKYILTGQLYTESLSFNIQQKVIQVMCEQYEGAQQLSQITQNLNISKQINKIIWNQGIEIEQRLFGYQNNYQLNTIILQIPKANEYQKIFNWLMAGYQFNYQYYEQKQNLNLEEEIVYEMFKQKLQFVQILMLKDQYFKYFEKIVYNIINDYQINLLLDTKILIQMFQNKAQLNISLLIDIFDMLLTKEDPSFQYPGIIETLSIHYFGQIQCLNGKFIQQPHNKKLDQKSIESFNENIQLLLSIIDKKSQHEYQISYITNRNILIYLYPYITLKTLNQIGQQRLDLMINNTNQCPQIIILCQNQDLQIRLLNAYINLYKNDIEKLGPLRSCFMNNMPLLKICYVNLIHLKDPYIMQEMVRISKRLLISENEFFLENLHKLTIDSTNISFMFSLAFRQRNFKTLNALLLYSEQNQVQFLPTLISFGHDADSDDYNYIRATQQPYCIALNTDQYLSILKTNKQYTQQERNDHFLQILYIGQHEKLPHIIQYVNFDLILFRRISTIIWKLLNQYSLTLNDWKQEKNIKRKIPKKQNESQLPQDSLEIGRQIQFFHLPPNNRVRKQHKQLSQIPTLFSYQDQLEQFLNSNQQLELQAATKIFEKDKLKQFYEERRTASKQNQNYSTIFQSSGGQSTNQLKCFEFLQKYIVFNKITDSDTREMLEVQYALMFPQKQTIQETKILYNSIINIIHIRNNINQYPFLKSNLPKYIELIQQNLVEKDLTEYLVSDYQYLKRVIRAKITDKNALANIMIESNQTDEKSITFIRNYLKDYTGILNDRTLFYVKKEIKLIQLPRDITQQKKFKRKFQQLQPYMDISTFSYQNVTPTQMYLIKGRPDHIVGKYQFQQADLIAACLSNTWQSIEFILKSHPNPSQLGFEQNLFQTLIIYSNESCILNYFNQFLKSYSKDINRLMYRDDTPMLYYVIHKKMSQFFKQFYIDYLTQTMGAENQRNMLIKQLNSQPSELFSTNTQLKLGQYALLCNFYEIFDYFQLTQEDVQYIKTSRFLFSNDEQILDKLIFGQKYNIFCNLFVLLRPQVLNCTYHEPITVKQVKNKKEQKQKNIVVKKKKSLNLRFLVIQEIINLEKSIICLLYELNNEEALLRDHLNILLINEQQCHQIMLKHKYTPELVMLYLQLQGIEVPELDKNTTKAITLIKTLGKIEKHDKKQIVKDICLHCNQYYGSSHPVYKIAIQQFPDIFLSNEFLDLTLGNLELAILLIISQVDKYELNKIINNCQATVFTKETKQLTYYQTVVYSLVLLNCIIKDEFQEDFLLKRLIPQCQLSQILKILSNYQSVQTSVTTQFQELAFKFIEQIEFEDKQAVVNSLLSHYNERLSKSIELLLHLLAIQNIVENLTSFLQKISQNMVDQFKYKITLQNKPISFDGEVFEIPIIFNKQEGQFILENEKIESFIPQFKQQLFDLFINEDLQQKMEDIQNKYNEFNLECLQQMNPHDVQITNADQMIQQLFFFKNLLEPQPEVGVYHVDDVFAPHQHEQVRPPELTLGNQQSSIMQSSNMNNPQQGRQVSNQQQMKEDFQFMFELLPDNTYQVRQRKRQDKEELIFAEFYHFKLPKTIINLIKLDQEEYCRQYNGSNTISIIIQDFYKYSQYLTNVLSEQQQDEWIVNLPYTIKDYKFVYQEQLLSIYNIPKILNKMNYFIDNVKQLVGRGEDTQIVQWRIQIISFLEVLVSKLVEIQKGDSQVLNIYTIIDQIFEWDTLIMILHQILYNNLVKAQQVLKVIRGIYFEFNEIQNVFAPDEFASGLDAIFAFGNTTYLLYNHMLIVRLNVGLRQQSNPGQYETQIVKQRQNLSIFKQDNAIQQYIHSIINEYDFYTQIFTPEQLVQFLFNKLTVDRGMLSISNQISKLINKTITLSVDHQGLARIFSPEIQNIKQARTSERLKTYEQIWYILQRLSKYFKEDIFEYLKKQLTTDRFDEMFHIRLFTILEALKKGKPVSSITNSNERDISIKEKAIVLQKLCPLLPKSQIIVSFQFGFQVLKNYYTNNSKLGDVCTVCFCIDSKTNNVNTVQLVYNSKGGEFLFLKLDQKPDLLTKEQIIRQQNFYSSQKASNHEFLLISIEDIHSVIVFQPNWPSDQIFNQSIVNVFFTDAQGYLSISNEPKFLKKMVEIQLEQNEETKQNLLDRLFGTGVVNVFSDLTLTSLTPIFPDQINFEFTAHNLLKKQQSMVQGHSVQITITGDKFKVAPIELTPISIACYFETSKKFQQITKQFQKFLSQNPELPNISLLFDDNMNADPQYYLDSLANEINVLESFQNAYSEFKQDKSGPQFTNSLQFMLGWDSLKFRKEQIIRKFIKKVELHFITYDQTDLVVFENNTLKFYCTEQSQPEEYQILNFFNSKFLNFQENELKQYILPNNFEVKITKRYDNEQMKIIVELICLIDGLATLMKLKPITTKIQIISMFELPGDILELKNEFYFFKSGILYLIYNNYRDFSMATFLVDYLNQSTIKKQKLDHYQYTGPVIIKEACQIQLHDVFKGIENDQVEVTVLNTDSEPQEFNQFIYLANVSKQYLALKVGGEYCQIQIILSDLISEDLVAFMKQTTYQQIICSNIYLIFENLNYSVNVERQLQKVEFKFDQKSTNLAQFCITNKDLKVKTQFISDNNLLVKLYSDKSKQYKITSPFPISMIHGEKSQELTIAYISQYSQDLSQTLHVSLTLQEKVIPVSNENNVIQTGNGYGDPKLMKILLKSAKKVDQETLIHKNFEGCEYQEELQKGNTINMLSKQEIQSASRSGQGREDYIEFKDSLGNTVENFTYETLIFVHTLYPQIQYKPNAIRIKQGLQLEWQPVFKGIYKLFINDVRVQGKFVVLANIPSITTSVVEIEQVNIVPFYEPIPISFLLKDQYHNICGDIEQQTFNDCICEIQLIEGSSSKLQSSQKLITKFGQLNFTIHFEPKEIQAEDEMTQLIFLVQKSQLKSIPLKISGISLEKRRNKFQTELNNQFKSSSYSLSIRRMSFLQDLLLLADKKMNYSFNIKFANEPGIDAGGLKREFYDMIGTTLKDDQYKFFTPVPNNLQKHFLSNHFNKLKDKQVYALLFGKLIANAIANTYIIGIDIVYPFWKVVYGEQVNFQDLKVILDETTFRNLESIKLHPEQIDALCLDFTYNSVDLVNNGSNVAVTTENVDLYLDKVADYLIYQRYKIIYKSFIQGFDSVIDIKLFQKWLRPSEISLLTQGLSEIKADIILSKSTYSGGNNQHKSFWETYIMQAEPQMLRNMLKFITGSSAIPFDQSSYILQIQFMKNLDIRKLPLAHTCFKSIEVPHYTTYSQLKQKLDIAFTIGLEGYGFG